MSLALHDHRRIVVSRNTRRQRGRRVPTHKPEFDYSEQNAYVAELWELAQVGYKVSGRGFIAITRDEPPLFTPTRNIALTRIDAKTRAALAHLLQEYDPLTEVVLCQTMDSRTYQVLLIRIHR
jgi:hypothetical protein